MAIGKMSRCASTRYLIDRFEACLCSQGSFEHALDVTEGAWQVCAEGPLGFVGAGRQTWATRLATGATVVRTTKATNLCHGFTE
jgi:hypothetical protein